MRYCASTGCLLSRPRVDPDCIWGESFDAGYAPVANGYLKSLDLANGGDVNRRFVAVYEEALKVGEQVRNQVQLWVRRGYESEIGNGWQGNSMLKFVTRDA